MINNSALSSSMSIADLAPKAATKLPEPRQGDNAFGEALAGAHTVHDRRESQAADHSRRDWAQGDRSTERTRGQDRAREVRSDAADHADRPDRTSDDVEATAPDAAADTTEPTATTDDTSATTTTRTDESEDTTPTATTETGTDTAAEGTDAAMQATVAVAAAPVATDLDAIIVPTANTVTQVATDAIDAAIRLAIAPIEATTTDAATPVAATTTATVAAATDVETDVDAQLVTAAVAQGAEDAEADDVQAGPMRPITSTSTTTSGPSPVLAEQASSTAEQATTKVNHGAQVSQVAKAGGDVVAVATGNAPDAGAAQLAQAAAVEVDADASLDADVVDTAAATAGKQGKADAAATQVAAATVDAELAADPEAPEVAQAARLNQTQAPTVAVNAQAQAQAQAKAAEQSAEDGGDAAPAKLEPLPSQAAPIATAARGDGVGAAVRMREGLQAQVQERIDHIAEQLATRLRLSHAAGGSQVQLSLKPRELGEVTVQMNVREGAVAATILVDKADTLRTLQTNIEDLKKSLESQGLQIGEFSVDVRGDSGAGGANARAAADLNANAGGRSRSGAAASLAGAAAATPGLSGDREVSADEAHDGDVSVLA